MNTQSLLSTLLVVLLPVVIPLTHAASVPLPRSTPEAQGISSQAVREFVEALDKINSLHSFVVVRHGQVIAEGWWKPEAADKPHVLNSVSKSFNSTAVGLAIADGKLSLDDHVMKFFPAEAPSDASDNLKAMTVRDLLPMTGGHVTEPKEVGGAPSVKQFLAHPVAHKPGTHFQYNGMGSYTLSAIVTKVTGQTVGEFLKPRLFEPLGIESAKWPSSPEGYSLGAHGLYLRTEDIAKLGQLYLQKGKWNGTQLFPEKWAEQASSKQVPNDQESHAKIGIDWQQGYGFQFWRCTHNAYRGDGAGGQFCVVMPDQDMVIAMTAGGANMQGQLDAIWNNLLPACQPKALPDDAAGREKVKEVIAKLAVHTPTTKSASATPCMDVLDRFTAADVPAMGPDETFSPAGKWTNGITPPNLPGKGLAQHPMLYVGENYDKMFLIKDGKVIWNYSTGTSYEYDDVWMLSNGNILFTRMDYIAEITPDKKTVWRYDCNKAPGTNHTEIHTCQPIGLDKVMFVLNGLPPKLMVVNIKTGAVEVEHALPFNQPPNPNGIHGQYRRTRVTAQGTYLVPVFGMGFVVEYDKNFNEIWRYKIKSPWAAIRLKNGNTLITDEADSLTREVNSKGETVWEFNTKKELPAEYQLSSAPQTATRLANGNTIFTSRGDNGKGPQLIEVTRDKKIVWVLRDWKTLCGATAVQILDDPGIPENPGESEH